MLPFGPPLLVLERNRGLAKLKVEEPTQVTNQTMMPPGLLLWSDISTDELIRLVELADSTGYSEFWYTDIRFFRDCYVGLALAARHSKTMLLGPGVSDPYNRHPALIAQAVASLHEASRGRGVVGLGTGVPLTLALTGQEQVKPVRALREAIEIIRQMFAGDSSDYRGELFQLLGGKLGFPLSGPPIPIFVATHSPQVLKLCGRLADGILLANLGRREAIENATAMVREGEAEAGRPAGSVAVHLRLETCISDDDASAVDVMRRRLAMRLVNTFPRWDFLGELGISATEDMREAAGRKDQAAVAALLHDDDVRASTLVGSVDKVVAHLKRILTPEVRKLTIRPLAVPGQQLEYTVAHFIEGVWPQISAGLRQEA